LRVEVASFSLPHHLNDLPSHPYVLVLSTVFQHGGEGGEGRREGRKAVGKRRERRQEGR
jgi:hypothetical protein